MNDNADLLLMRGVARPCPDCAEERLFVPADLDRGEQSEFCCTWCGAALLIDPAHAAAKPHAANVA